jgi:formate--tetrahydrofolate ligase
MEPILEVARSLDLAPEEIEPYGRDKAKVRLDALAARSPRGALVLVSAITPTPAGEGKSTISIARIGVRSMVVLPEPSFGPFKGGGTGGGVLRHHPAPMAASDRMRRSRLPPFER